MTCRNDIKIAVAGFSGQVGSAVLKYLRSHYPDANLILLGRQRSKAIMQGTNRFENWEATQNSRHTEQILKGVDIVVNLAAYIPNDQSDPTEAKQCLNVNAIGALNLAMAAKEAGVKTYIYVSGTNVISKSDLNCMLESEDLPTFEFEYAPYYLSSKALGELYVKQIASVDFNVKIIRLSSIYNSNNGLLVNLIKRLKIEGNLQLKNGNMFGGDFLHVDDAAVFIDKFMRDETATTANIGSGHRTTLKEAMLVAANQLQLGSEAIKDTVSVEHAIGFAAVNMQCTNAQLGFSARSISNGIAGIIEGLES